MLEAEREFFTHCERLIFAGRSSLSDSAIRSRGVFWSACLDVGSLIGISLRYFPAAKFIFVCFKVVTGVPQGGRRKTINL
jgi:hypothetical protein